MEQLVSHWTDFHEIWYLSIFRKSVQKIQVLLKYDKNNGYFTWRPIYILTISRWILLRVKNVSDKSCRENQNTHFIFKNFSQQSCRLWDNVEKYGRARQTTDSNIKWRMRFACWITMATDTHAEYVILIAFSRQKWLRERATMLAYSTLSVLCKLVIFSLVWS
jgi:hypothetical protein